MTPNTLASIPTALATAGDTATLDTPIDDFLRLNHHPRSVARAVQTVAMILRVDRINGLCSSEADNLLANRFSPEITRQVCKHLWGWLLSRVPGPGTRLADAEYESQDIRYDDVDDVDDDDDLDDDDEMIDDIPSSLSVPRPFALAHESLPNIEAPPKNGEALERWAEKYNVHDRLDDRLDLGYLRHSHYGSQLEGLPATLREAVVMTPTSITAPQHYRDTLVFQLVEMAKAHLHRAAQAVAIARRRQTERAARTRPTDDPFLQRLEALVRREHDRLAAKDKPRPEGTFLPGRIELAGDPPNLAYREWSVNDGRTPSLNSEVTFLVHLATWDSGNLRLECKRCRDPLHCPHGANALQELLEVLHDPADPLAAALAPVLRVPGWSRLLDHLDAGLGKSTPIADKGQRLIWEVCHKAGRLTVFPVLQRLGKRGTWGRGQRLRLDALEHKQELLRDLSDRNAFEGLMYSHSGSGYYYGEREQTPRQIWRALAALAGSTRVFADPTRAVPISVRKVRPTLSVETVEDGFRLRLALGPVEIEPDSLLRAATDDRHVVFLDGEHERCLLALLEPGTTALLKAMAKFPITLPAEGVTELVGRLPRLQGALDVHLPEAVRGERVESPTTTLCRLEPMPEAGMRLDMAVRPINDGPLFPPGEGPPEVLHARDGRQLARLAQSRSRTRACRAPGRSAGTGQQDGERCLALGRARRRRGARCAAQAARPARASLCGMAGRRDPRGPPRVRGIEGSSAEAARLVWHRRWHRDRRHAVPLSELLAAARSGRRYIRLNPHSFATLEDEMRERLAALDDVVFENHQGAIELGLLAAPVLADLVEDPSQLTMVPAFRSVLGKLETARTETAALPEGLQATLRHYQVDGFQWLARLAEWGLGACLADDMGLGKTVQALALLLRRADLGPALVIAPTSVVANWAAECAKFAPSLLPRIYRGSGRATLLEDLGKGGLLVMSYAIAVRDAEALGAIQFATLIIDEAQSVKNALTQRFRAVRDLQADFRLALTGTPIENHLGELWAIFRLVTPGLFGSWEQFRQRFAMPIERHHDRARQMALARVVRPFLLRRTKAEVAPELPSRTEMNQTIELGPTERRLYEAARIEALESLAKSAAAGIGDEAKQRIKILAALTRLRLLCCHPRLVVKDSTASSSKLAALVELLTELRDEGHRALVFSQFTSFLDLARPLLAQAGPAHPDPRRLHTGGPSAKSAYALSKPAPPTSSCFRCVRAAPAST
jgi:hypothetical protein